jgi:cellulose biosynthesis protein BcsQ
MVVDLLFLGVIMFQRQNPKHGGPMLITVANLKGGSGKTTWACEVAGYLEAPLIDLDPQGDASIWAQTKERPFSAPLANRAAGELADARDSKRWFVADCPPAESKVTVTALQFAHVVLVPVKGGPQDLQGWGRMRSLLNEIRAEQPHPCKVGIIANGMRHVGTLGDVLDALKEEHDPKNGIHYLGSVGLRQATTYAYLEGGTVALQNNEAGAEFRGILEQLQKLIR